MIQRSLILVKPDGVVRGLIGEVIKRFEQRGLKILGIKMVRANRELAEKHYTEDIAKKHGEHVRRGLLDFITSEPVVAFVVEGINAVEVVRKIVGSTYPNDAPIGTIRGDFAHISRDYANSKQDNAKGIIPAVRNIVHASGNVEEAKVEIGLWFKENELHKYSLSHEPHIF